MLNPEEVQEHRRRAIVLHDFFLERRPVGKYTPTKRNTLLVALCSLATEHHGAIILLSKDLQYMGSALALLRPVVESCLRAIWTSHCATDVEIDAIVKKVKEFPALKRCNKAVSDFYESSGHPGILGYPMTSAITSTV